MEQLAHMFSDKKQNTGVARARDEHVKMRHGLNQISSTITATGEGGANIIDVVPRDMYAAA